MALAQLQSSLGRIFRQRCFYLFLSLLVLLAISPFFAESIRGRMLLGAAHVVVLIAAVAAVGRTTFPFVIALLLGLPAFAFQVFGLLGIDEFTHAFVVSSVCFVAFYVTAIVYLLRYAFSPEVMTDDKLFAGAAVYLMLGIGWAIAYNLIQRLDPASFAPRSDAEPHAFSDLLFMSFGYLTSNGPGDVVIVGAKVRILAIFEQIVGTLYVAILIARLAGIYPTRDEGRI
jgi:hypothetical protein